MRILVVDNGLGPFVAEQIESIRKTDKSINIIRYSFSGKNNKLNYIKAIFEINKLIRKYRIDIIHAHYGLTGLISLFQNKCPVICTFHGSDVLYVKWQSLISRFVAKHCAASIAVSKKIAKILNTKNTYVIPCGVNQDFFKPENKTEVRKKLHLDINKKYILFPSDPKRKVKNYPLFYSVFNKLKKEYDIEQLILKGLDRKGVKNFLNASDLVLLTSFSEGSNSVIKEALSCDVPVISVDVGDAKDILEKEYLAHPDIELIVTLAKRILSTNKSKFKFRSKIKFLDNKNISKIIINLYKHFNDRTL